MKAPYRSRWISASCMVIVSCAWVATACVGEDPAPAASTTGIPPGERGGACKDGVCSSGLTCASDVCILADASAGTPDTSVDAVAESDAIAEGGVDACAAPSSCACPHDVNVLISEIRSRGPDPGAAANDFVELYNPSASAVTLGSSWTLQFRGDLQAGYNSAWVGTNKTIAAHGHYLIVGSSYTGPTGDGVLSIGISDAGSLVLSQAGTVHDAVCYAYDATTTAHLGAAGFTCRGAPIKTNPHNNTTGTDNDASIERRPSADAGGGCFNTDDNATDFKTATPSTPQSP